MDGGWNDLTFFVAMSATSAMSVRQPALNAILYSEMKDRKKKLKQQQQQL